MRQQKHLPQENRFAGQRKHQSQEKRFAAADKTDEEGNAAMKVWDLHCDTLSELRYAENSGHPVSFEENGLMMDLKRMKEGDYLLQCFGCFVNLGRKNENPLKACMEMIDIFYRMLDKYPELMQIKTPQDIRELKSSGKIGAMLTVEEGAVCLDDVRVLRDLYRLGVRMMTLTWNYDNGLAHPNTPISTESRNSDSGQKAGSAGDPNSNTAGGQGSSFAAVQKTEEWPMRGNEQGLTSKGIEFVEEMNRLHMIIDVSHLSDGGFRDVARYSKMPFAASHSDCRALTGHARNLTDEMIRTMAERGGLIGLNYCAQFLDPDPDRTAVKSRIIDMTRHARHMFDVGGEDILALGSDFDGIDGDLEIKGAQDMPLLADGLRKAGFTQRQVDKIFHANAERFFGENL